MKKIIVLPLFLAGMLALTGCDIYGTSTSTLSQESDIADFTLVEDSETAETTFAEAKAKNTELDNVSGFEGTFSFTGTMTDEDDEEVIISSTMIERVGIIDSHFASDLLITSSYGTYNNYIRFNTTENSYYDYMNLNFTYEDDEGTETTIDKNLFVEDDSYTDSTVFDDAEISEYIDELHMLSSISYSADMNVYISVDGYYKFDIFEGDETEIIICDSDGAVIELQYIQDGVTAVEEIEYSANFENVDTEEYEERGFEYSFEFAFQLVSFMTLSIGIGI
jgi:hypothetical protein